MRLVSDLNKDFSVLPEQIIHRANAFWYLVLSIGFMIGTRELQVVRDDL